MRVNTLRPRQNGRHFPDDIFKCIFLDGNLNISIKISLKFVPKVAIINISALVQIMAWCRPGDKPLSKPIMVSLLMYICVTRPQWVNTNKPSRLCITELFVRGIRPWRLDSLHKGPVMQKALPRHDVIVVFPYLRNQNEDAIGTECPHC